MSPLKDQIVESSVDWNNRRVAQILEAAAKCFARKGFNETSVKDIAAKVGVTKSMVHYYFDSKVHLLHEVLAFNTQKHLNRVTDQMKVSGDSSLERSRTALKSLWKTIREERRAFRLSLEFWALSARDAKLRERVRKTHTAGRELITVGIEDALGIDKGKLPFSTEALGALILAVLNGLAVQEYAEPDGVDMDETFRLFLASLMGGMAMLGMGMGGGAPAAPPAAEHDAASADDAAAAASEEAAEAAPAEPETLEVPESVPPDPHEPTPVLPGRKRGGAAAGVDNAEDSGGVDSGGGHSSGGGDGGEG